MQHLNCGYSEMFWRNGSTKHKHTKKKATKDCQIADTASVSHLTWKAKIKLQITTKNDVQFDKQKRLELIFEMI